MNAPMAGAAPAAPSVKSLVRESEERPPLVSSEALRRIGCEKQRIRQAVPDVA